ncbi:hypothetical protein [Parvimonas sp. G1967]|uniref:hypothetical protein n=1 Tax=Parvimonas sp. G1967 TaxID=3387695 RepID=UPI0039E6D15A
MNVLYKQINSEPFMLFDLGIKENGYEFASDIKTALSTAEGELDVVSAKLEESLDSLKNLKPECDKTDYILSACSGALCGVMDVFLVGKPGESPIGEITDKWFANRTEDFARLCGWTGEKGNLSSAVRHLEKKFKIPYDQNGIGDISKELLDLTPINHHFKSLGHNPTILGLFFSMLDQFANTSHFVSEGELITFSKFNGDFHLDGKDIPSKLFCGFANWFGHLISDLSGSSTSKGRGMGIPSPFWSWTNDIISIKRKLNLPVGEFDKSLNEIALDIYKQGYDTRFQTAQTILVFVNELLVRFVYSIRRLVRYFSTTKNDDRSFKLLWKSCEPFSNATVKRMLTVAHGTYCFIDAGDAIARGFVTGGGSFNVTEFVLRLNIIGIGRFAISLYGETSRGLKRHAIKEDVIILKREKLILDDYVDGLKFLAEIYDDESLLLFTKELKESDMYIQAFEKTIILAEKRNVPKDEILRNKANIDSYFKGGRKQ